MTTERQYVPNLPMLQGGISGGGSSSTAPQPEPAPDDPVNPKHYASFGDYAAIHIIRAWNRTRAEKGVEPVSFDVGNALKYIQRAGLKPGQDEIRDLGKAIWYLQERIHVLDPTEPDPAR